jgi:aminoglycoside phosphotransferase (APT) family kinase protein
MTDQKETELLERLRRLTASDGGRLGARLQSLWGGYGAIYRYHPADEKRPLIVKYVSPKGVRSHPRGWASDRGHERKLKSYDVELSWYQSAAQLCRSRCRVAEPRYLEKTDNGWLFLLEDLDDAGFSARRSRLNRAEMRACLSWLAEFHALHLERDPEGLWDPGTYWHLATRPDELLVMQHERLKSVAHAIDATLNGARFRTWVHGDAKVENFCFSEGAEVAAVDFQYVGGGVGVQDVAYFLSSCLDEQQCLKEADTWLEEYFQLLQAALRSSRPDVEASEVIAEWRRLYPYAWADFTRFLLGWAPTHFKLHGYSKKLTEVVLQELGR